MAVDDDAIHAEDGGLQHGAVFPVAMPRHVRFAYSYLGMVPILMRYSVTS
jgi:hypothetical protein